MSEVQRRERNRLWLKQETRGRVLFFSKKTQVLLVVTEDRRRKITFRDISKSNFDLYEGFWQIDETDGRTKVLYHLTARPGPSLPKLFLKGALKKMATKLLEEVRNEIVRRR